MSEQEHIRRNIAEMVVDAIKDNVISITGQEFIKFQIYKYYTQILIRTLKSECEFFKTHNPHFEFTNPDRCPTIRIDKIEYAISQYERAMEEKDEAQES